MPAHRARRATDALTDNHVPRPSPIIGLILIATLGLALAGSTWPPLPQPTGPTSAIAITPDDPAAPSPTPAQSLGR
jgi:hypothetical protein